MIKPKKEKSLHDYKIEIIEVKKKYLINKMEFRRKMLKGEEIKKLRDKKKLY